MGETANEMIACPVCHNPTFCYPDGRRSCLRCEWEDEKWMSKEEAVARAMCRDYYQTSFSGNELNDCVEARWEDYLPSVNVAIAAADKWDAEHNKDAAGPLMLHDMKTGGLYPAPRSLSPGLDSAIQDELDHPPASIMEEGK